MMMMKALLGNLVDLLQQDFVVHHLGLAGHEVSGFVEGNQLVPSQNVDPELKSTGLQQVRVMLSIGHVLQVGKLVLQCVVLVLTRVLKGQKRLNRCE